MDSLPELNINIFIDKIKQIFLIYMLILIKLDILKINESIKIIYLFYKNNINLVSDNLFFLNIFDTIKNLNNNDLNIFFKYLTFLHIIGKIDDYHIEFLKLVNQSKLFKNTERKLDTQNLQSNQIHLLTDDFNNIKDELCEIKKYIDSFEIHNNKNNFLKQFLFIKNDLIKKIHKDEIIGRLELLFDMIGYKLLLFIINKKNRKKKEIKSIDNLELELLTFSDLYNMEYNKAIKYCFLFFLKLDKNIDSFIQDFEFVKYLKIIVINYIINGEDKITSKFHEKIIKKYVFI